jgi:glycosyltransferase involved in cell wall biosynthesis
MILLLCFDLRRRGGIERLSLQVCDSLQRQGHRVQVISTRRLGPGALGRWFGRCGFVLQLVWWLPKAQQVLSMHVLLLKPALWLKPQQLSCWLHGIEVWGAAGRQHAVDLQRCQQLIASSQFTLNQLSFRPKRAAVVHPMADLIDPELKPTPIPAELRLLTVARLCSQENYKGHGLILEALAQLPAAIHWQVVGDGDQRPKLEAQAKTFGLTNQVQFSGSLNDQELREAFENCSVFVMPSRFEIQPNGDATGEGFGIVYLEAALAGRASIACDQGGQTDFIIDGECGWLIPPEVSALTSVLSNLLENSEEIKRRGQLARARALEHFGRERFDQALCQAIEV